MLKEVKFSHWPQLDEHDFTRFEFKLNFANLVGISFIRGWTSTQPNRFAHNIATHHRSAHNPAGRWCAGSAVCNLPRQHCRLAQRWSNVGTIVPTLGQRWSNLHCCLTNQVVKRVTHTQGWCTPPSQHTTEPPQGCVQLGGVLLGYV